MSFPLSRDALLAQFSTPRRVLDKGFLGLEDVMGDDASIVRRARVSTGKGTSPHVYEGPHHRCTACGLPRPLRALADREDPPDSSCAVGDRKLIEYMLAHHHASPFEFAEIILRIRLPIFVMRQLVRHWSWSFQEYSMRYTAAIDDIFAVEPNAWRAQGETNRQGSTGVVTTWPKRYSTEPWGEGFAVFHHEDDEEAPPGARMGAIDQDNPGLYLSERQAELHELTQAVYQERLRFGVAKELARVDLPVGNYTEVYAKCSLRDLLNVLALRLDAHAQPEIRAYAEAIVPIVKAWVPLSWAAFERWRLHATVLNQDQVQTVQALLEDLLSFHEAQAEGEGRPFDADAWWKAQTKGDARLMAALRRPS